MITFKPVVALSGRRKDGTWPVRIRVTFKGVVRRLPTTLVCTEADLTRGGRIKNQTILAKASELIGRMRATCDNLSPFTLEEWDVDRVVSHIREVMTAETFRLDFFTFADSYLICKTNRSTRQAYDKALNALSRFLGERRLDVNDVTRRLLLDFVAYIDAEPRMRGNADGRVTPTSKPKKAGGGASATHLMKLAHIFNAARMRYNDEDTGRILIPRSPFDGLKKSYPPGMGAKALDTAAVQLLIDDCPEDALEDTARRIFLVSLCTMGANLADLYEAPPQTLGKVWTYNRRKTATRRADRAEVRILLPEQLSLISAKGNGLWWFPELHRWKDANTATSMVNKGLKKIAERLGLEPFTFYAARKTWATLARRLGVEKATIDEALAHVGDFRVTDIYAERNWSLAWEANRKVLDLFSWG